MFLKNALNIPTGETDIRNAIAVMIEKHAEKLENDWDEDGDDEIYFFFTEIARAFDSYERIKVPRVARVCAVRP